MSQITLLTVQAFLGKGCENDSTDIQTALYVTPVAWTVLFIVSLLKFNISWVPIESYESDGLR